LDDQNCLLKRYKNQEKSCSEELAVFWGGLEASGAWNSFMEGSTARQNNGAFSEKILFDRTLYLDSDSWSASASEKNSE
jgi:hypothetical protein